MHKRQVVQLGHIALSDSLMYPAVKTKRCAKQPIRDWVGPDWSEPDCGALRGGTVLRSHRTVSLFVKAKLTTAN